MTEYPLGTRFVTQVAFLVHDIEKTSKAYARFLGLPVPAVKMTGPVEESQAEFRGQRTIARAKLAFFDVGENLRIELIEPDKNPSTWRECLDRDGEGFHHIAFVIKDMKDKVNVLGTEGMPLLQRGEYKGGRYAYIDASGELKTILELLEND